MKHLYILFIITSLATSTFAQPINQYLNDVVLPTPNEAALGKYGDIPVSHYTGIPNISIPIHTLLEGPLSHNVSLSYHAGGVRVAEVASRVGLNWSLKAGGFISRSVNGLRDDKALKGYYHEGSSVDPTDFSVMQSIANGFKDGEADLFTFSCGGHYGQFYYTDLQEVVLVPKQDVKIVVKEDNGGNFESFIVTTPDGNRYHFGEYGGTKAQDVMHVSISAESYISNWHLMRIETYDQAHSINFNYENDVYSYTVPASCKLYQQSCNDPSGSSFSINTSCQGIGPFQLGVGQNFPYNNISVVGKRLASIATSTETVTFNSITNRIDLGNSSFGTTNKKRLNSIDIQMGSGSSYCKRFDLAYTNLTDNNVSLNIPSKYRLRLDSVQEKSCNGTITIPAHSFSYNTLALPWRHSKAVDHWGYYNGQLNNNNQDVNIPPTSINVMNNDVISFGQSNREANGIFMGAGLLESITYPTGGTSSFIYEPNIITVSGLNESTHFDFTNCVTPSNQGCCGFPDVATDAFTVSSTLQNTRLTVGVNAISLPNGICDETNISAHVYIYKNGLYFWDRGFNHDFLPSDPDHFEAIFDSSHGLPTFTQGNYTVELLVYSGRGNTKLVSGVSTQVPELIGGLRLKQYTSHDGRSSTNDIIRSYSYTKEASTESSGVLLYKPKYGQFLSAAYIESSGWNQLTNNVAIWSATSFVPMSSFESNHIGYARVTEDYNGNGEKVYEYCVAKDPANYITQYPEPPLKLNTSNGKLQKETFLSESNIELKSTEIQQSGINFQEISSKDMIRISEPLACSVSGVTLHFFTPYKLNTEIYLVSKKTVKLDGVTIVEDIAYDNIESHYQPVSTTRMESDGTKYHTIYTYPKDYFGSAYANLENLNVITPIKIETKVGNNINTAQPIDGTETLFKNFTVGGILRPYPEIYKRYERTWNSAGTLQPGVWVDQAIVNSYDDVEGMPTSITIDGWSDPHQYEYNDAALRTSETFKNFTKTYDYYQGTRLLSGMTNIDQTSQSFTYDPLFRSKTFKDDCRNVVTTLSYHYGSPSSGGNSIISSTDYPNVSLSDLDIIRNKQFFDGLGRPIQLIKEDQGATSNQDMVTATEYDNQGRVKHTYEPKGFNANNGAFISTLDWDKSTTAYEASPLDRPASTTHDAWNFPTSIEYGANTSTINGYTQGELYKQTTIDQDSRQSISYTDSRGRNIASVMAGANGVAPLTTLYNYDDKDRVTKIIPPGSTAGHANLNFNYTYYRNDLVQFKKVPDADNIEYRYNDRDLLTGYKDGFLSNRQSNKWIVTDFDDYGRQIKNGFGNALSNNNANDPTITNSNRLTQSSYYSTGNHIDKPQYHESWILNPDGTLNSSLSIRTQSLYDACGRVLETRANSLMDQSDFNNGNKHVYTYDAADNMTFDDHQQLIPSISLYTDSKQTIDFAGRPEEYLHRINAGNNLGEKSIALNSYNEKSLLAKLQLGFKSGSGYLESCNYTYKGNQWLEQMNGSLFDYTMYYNSSPLTAGQLQKNGNISEIKWKVIGEDEHAFGYSYDNYNRLTNSYSKNQTKSISDGYNTSYGYDARGNLTSLTRKDFVPGNGNLVSTTIDSLTYTPVANSNQIKSISDAATSEYKHKGLNSSNGGNYMYDGNGNMTYDPTKDMTISYNHLNLPLTVDFGEGKTIEWTYDAVGTKLRKQVKNGASIMEDRHYVGSAEYNKGVLTQVMHDYGRVARQTPCNDIQYVNGLIDNANVYEGSAVISDSYLIPPGNTTFEGVECVILTEDFEVEQGKTFEAKIEPCYAGNWEYQYRIGDHLDNTRVIFADQNNNGSITPSEIIQEMHYSPFGRPMTGEWNSRDRNDYDYTYNDKEFVEDYGLGWMDYGARFYDPSIGRFTSVDPLASEMPGWSAYSYTFNNPINLTDPTGMYPEPPAWLSKGINWIRDKVDLKFSAKLTMGYQIGLKNNFTQFNAKYVAEIAEISLSTQNGSEIDYVGKDGEIEGMTGAGIGIGIGLTGDDPVGIGLTYERQITELVVDGTVVDETISNEVILPNGIEGSFNSDDKVAATLETEVNLILIGIEISGGVEIDRKDE